MDSPKSIQSRHWGKSLKSVFRLFFRIGLRSQRIKIFFLFSLIPVGIAALFRVVQLTSGPLRLEGIYIFSNIIMAFYLQFLILILALFFGSSVCLEELDNSTLPFLVTRPVPKWTVIAAKYAAYNVLAAVIMLAGVFSSFLILSSEKLAGFSTWRSLVEYSGVLVLGLFAYSAFFTFMGTFVKRSILFGLIFSFGWENVIQYFPGSTQRFALVHYLKSLLPNPGAQRFSFLLFRLEPTSPLVSILVLAGVILVFIGLACLIFTRKEYILDD